MRLNQLVRRWTGRPRPPVSLPPPASTIPLALPASAAPLNTPTPPTTGVPGTPAVLGPLGIAVPDQLPLLPQFDHTRYASATESLRSTAKWLLAAMAAVGAVLVAGLQLSRLGELDEWQWMVLAAVTAAAALGAVGYMIHQTATVLTDDWTTLADLTATQTDALISGTPLSRARAAMFTQLRTEIENNRQELFAAVAGNLPELHQVLQTSTSRARALAITAPSQAPEAAWAAYQSAYIQSAAERVIDFANYQRSLILFRRVIRRVLAAGAVVVVAVGLFAFSTNQSAEPAVTTVQILP